MTQHPTSRRSVAGRLVLLTAASLCLCLSSSAIAQHGGGARSMGGPGGAGMTPHPGYTAPDRRSDPTGFSRSNAQSHSQPPHMGLQLGLGGRWWDDHSTARRLDINPDQQRRMDTIFETNKPTLVNLYNNLQREESNLAGLSHADLQDESKVFAAIDRVSHARSDLAKENAHILLQIRQQLAPQQVQTLDRQIAASH